LKALYNYSGFPESPRTPQIPTQPVHKFLSYPLILELASILELELRWYQSLDLSCNNKPVDGIEEVSTLVGPAVLNHPPATINIIIGHILVPCLVKIRLLVAS